VLVYACGTGWPSIADDIRASQSDYLVPDRQLWSAVPQELDDAETEQQPYPPVMDESENLEFQGEGEQISTVIAFAMSDFPSVLQSFLHTEQHYVTPASQNAHNIGIFLAPAHSKPVHNRRSRVRADRVAGGPRSYAPGCN
jgi:hypothetical protein